MWFPAYCFQQRINFPDGREIVRTTTITTDENGDTTEEIVEEILEAQETDEEEDGYQQEQVVVKVKREVQDDGEQVVEERWVSDDKEQVVESENQRFPDHEEKDVEAEVNGGAESPEPIYVVCGPTLVIYIAHHIGLLFYMFYMVIIQLHGICSYIPSYRTW